MASLANRGRSLFAQATGHEDSGESSDEFDMEFSDSDDGESSSSSGGEMKFGADGAMQFGVVKEEVVEAGAVKPFIGSIFPPSGYRPSRSDNDAPNATLQLEYVFGMLYKSSILFPLLVTQYFLNLYIYHSYLLHPRAPASLNPGYCKKTRDAIFSIGQNKIFWPSAAVGIIYDSSQSGSSAQSHLIGHRDEITSAAQSSSNPGMIATGSSQLTRKHEYPTTILWDANKNSIVRKFQSSNCKRQVDALAFDDSGQYIFAAGAGDDHNIVCYSLRDGGETSYVSSGSSRVLAMDFDSSTKSLVVGGVKSLQFISFLNGNFGKPQRVGADTIISVKSSGPTTYCGSASGKISTYMRGTKTSTLFFLF